MPELLLALDAGTTSVRAMLVDPVGAVLGLDRRAVVSHYPAPGHVEQDPEAVWQACSAAIAAVLAAARRGMSDVAAIGVTTQRASTIVWDAATGDAVAPMLVWSDLRGLDAFRRLRAAGFVAWPQVPSAKLPAAVALSRRDPRGLRWGTLDSWLVHRLSGGAVHVTDASNAWLTGYLDFAAGDAWNATLLAYQDLPPAIFPTVVDSWGVVGSTPAGVPIAAVIADQQAGMVAHAALTPGGWKATYGTSAVLMASTGAAPLAPHPTMPPEALYRADGTAIYCAEGMVVSAGSLIEWLCGIGLFADPGALAEAAAADGSDVHIRPALAGLGAPHGDFSARGLVTGLSFATDRGDIARAALAAIAHRMREIAAPIAAALPVPETLPVDGGLAASHAFLQLQADTLQRPVRRHAVREGTAYGAALAAGMGIGLLTPTDLPRFARYDATVEPRIDRDQADAAFAAWQAATRPVG